MRRPACAVGRSVHTRLLAAFASIALFIPGLGTLLSAPIDGKLFRDPMIRDLEVLAPVVGENCISALVFDDPETAQCYLAACRT